MSLETHIRSLKDTAAQVTFEYILINLRTDACGYTAKTRSVQQKTNYAYETAAL